jgi:ubiquinone/menaquinone biosynthesis C-methylase UbiE
MTIHSMANLHSPLTSLYDHLSLADKDSVLDVACGNGRLLRMLSQKARINAHGIDVSEEMITAAQSGLKDAVFRVSSAEKMDFPECSFDFVTVCCAFHHFTKPDAFMNEAYRVLKGNGKLVIAELSPAPVIRWIENLIIPRMNMGDVRLYRIKELYEFFKKAGFNNITHIKKRSMVIIEGRAL